MGDFRLVVCDLGWGGLLSPSPAESHRGNHRHQLMTQKGHRPGSSLLKRRKFLNIMPSGALPKGETRLGYQRIRVDCLVLRSRTSRREVRVAEGGTWVDANHAFALQPLFMAHRLEG